MTATVTGWQLALISCFITTSVFSFSSLILCIFEFVATWSSGPVEVHFFNPSSAQLYLNHRQNELDRPLHYWMKLDCRLRKSPTR
uniref:Uncharacterized protein n=1 Tax=Strigamia maritima TaxID=126957 RepID=T1IHX7_STRMM